MARGTAIFMLCLLITVSLCPGFASAAGELYVLNYIGNDGTIYGSEYVYGGTSVTVKDASDMNVRHRGYSFVEWTSNINGSGIAYAAGDTITVNNHLNLYAQWMSGTVSSPVPENDNAVEGDNTPLQADSVNETMYGWLLLFLCVCIIVGLLIRRGVSRRHSERRNCYLAQFGDRQWCSIEQLASGIGKSKRYAKKDIAKMIRRGFFPGARLMNEIHCLILSEQGYEEYLTAKQSEAAFEHEQRQQREAEEKIAQETEQERTLRLTIEQGYQYIHVMSVTAEALAEQEITTRIREITQITEGILIHIEKHPGQVSQIRRFVKYYLPMTLKFIDTYKEFDSKLADGSNITTSKQEIANALDLVYASYKKLLDGLYKNISMDISADISVLEVLLAQEGLMKEAWHG